MAEGGGGEPVTVQRPANAESHPAGEEGLEDTMRGR